MMSSYDELEDYRILRDNPNIGAIEFFLSLNCTITQAYEIIKTHRSNGVLSYEEYILALGKVREAEKEYTAIFIEQKEYNYEYRARPYYDKEA